jgi:outer membrane protein assembly factor BamE (lipoprotein component of BamABCDE complex)
MKMAVCLLTVLATIVTPAVAQQSSIDHLIVPGQRIGQIKVGMSLSEVEALIGRPSTSRPLSTQTVILQPGKSMLYTWQLGPGNGLSVQTTVSNEVYLVGTFATNYGTSEGLHVGSRLSEVTSMLGAPSRTIARPSIGANYLVYDDRGIEFVVGADSTKSNFQTVMNVFVFRSPNSH